MPFSVEHMNGRSAREILQWRYEPPYDFYNNEAGAESMAELLDGTYRTVWNDENRLIGFFCTGASAQVPAGRNEGVYPEDYIDFGLGMDPLKTGQGKGTEFLSFVLGQIEKSHPGMPLRLTVATFNRRAIRLYEKFGFVREKGFRADSAEFITMKKPHSK